MNQIDTGKFIASCRKEKGLTQAQLAEKLNITDRAVPQMGDRKMYAGFIYHVGTLQYLRCYGQ